MRRAALLLLPLSLVCAALAAAADNPLAREASPFLRLHGQDPIDWYPYGDEAFAEARRRGKPLFVSVGHITCSGCVKMASESFGDPEVARALGADFVAVMVDRDGRPDLAEAYARIAAEMGEPIGFPLHLFLLPDGSPFHAATYLPRHDHPGKPGILTVLASVTQALAKGGAPLARRGEVLRAAVATQLETATRGPSAAPGPADLVALVEAQRLASDPEFGGRTTLPKRPTEPSAALQLRHHRRSGEARSLEAALLALERMAAAPIRDGTDGGFHEGSAAADWSEPRPDRRLGDNAWLAVAYLEGWQASGRMPLRDVADGALGFLLAKMRAPGGGFVATVNGDERDPQVLAGANGLAISALARGGFALGAPHYVDAARAAARFALAKLRQGDGLRALWADGRAGPPATLADHALLIAGLLDLLEADADPAWLDAALALQAEQELRFGHPEGGYYLTAGAPGPGLPRPRHARDGALPSGQGVAALNGLRLAALTGDAAYAERADRTLAAFRDAMRAEPLAHAALGLALDARLDGLHEIVVALGPETDASPPLLAPVRSAFVPNRVLLVVRDGAVPPRLAERARLLSGKRALAGASTAFVCRDHVCTLPARDPDVLARQLARFTPLGEG
jgi:hypothetical protein